MKNEPIVWEDSFGNLLLGNVESESEHFYDVYFISAEMKRKNAKPIPVGTKYLVNKKAAFFPLNQPI